MEKNEYKSIKEHEKDTIAEKLRGMPGKISELEDQVRIKNRLKEDYELQKKVILNEIMSVILSAKNEQDKPLYPNELMRKNAAITEAAKNSKLNEVISLQNTTISEIEETMTSIRFFHNFIKIEGIIVQMKGE